MKTITTGCLAAMLLALAGVSQAANTQTRTPQQATASSGREGSAVTTPQPPVQVAGKGGTKGGGGGGATKP
jgi:hypothetical protein